MQNLRQLQLHNQASASHPLDPSDSSGGIAAGRWAAKLLQDCAVAVAEKDSAKIHHLLWMLNELPSPYGDREQHLVPTSCRRSSAELPTPATAVCAR